uniref:G-protein coupled receptors family 2 profile 2 domain-containing protein n=1 Tax=Setaria digitata TaxID=48799 RepID=A0A915PZR3_9BILA
MNNTSKVQVNTGVPFAVVFCWTIIHQRRSSQNQNSFCWLPYAQGAHLWILSATMGLALILNLLFLLGIVVILVQKLRAENTAESKKIWRMVKSTLLLVPLLGVSNIPLFYEPSQPSSAYMLGSAILQHSQGIFIAVLYCFLNGEVQNAVKRQLLKLKMHIISERPRFETERNYIPNEANELDGKLAMPMEEVNNTGDLKTHIFR